MVTKSDQVAPVLKWVGGKRQLLDALGPLIPKRFSRYCEPFFGGGAVLFALQPNRAIVNDLNHELIGVYEVIRDQIDELILSLRQHDNSPEYFYELRNLDRDPKEYLRLSKLERASRIIYLNKTCFNGLFRVNRQGEFNAPFGHYKNPNIVNETVLRAVSRFFNSCNVTFYSEDFSSVLRRLEKGTFVYLDPPYDPLSDSSNFTGYSRGGFSRADQLRLKECCDELSARGIKFMLSNSSTDFIRELYSDYNITTVDAKRCINVKGDKRGPVHELVVRNYRTRSNRIPLILMSCNVGQPKLPELQAQLEAKKLALSQKKAAKAQTELLTAKTEHIAPTQVISTPDLTPLAQGGTVSCYVPEHPVIHNSAPSDKVALPLPQSSHDLTNALMGQVKEDVMKKAQAAAATSSTKLIAKLSETTMVPVPSEPVLPSQSLGIESR